MRGGGDDGGEREGHRRGDVLGGRVDGKKKGCGGGGGELMGGRTCRSDRGSCLNEINEFNVLN